MSTTILSSGELPAGLTLRGNRSDYRILRPLDKGGSGQAYLATGSPEGNDLVVVKVPLLNSTLPWAERVAQHAKVDLSLRRELSMKARLAALPCVAHILDSGYCEILAPDVDVVLPALFVVQNLVSGKRLDRYVKSPEESAFTGLASARAFFDVALKVARGLQAIHRLQVVHGDVWFQNVFIDDAKEAVFIDFGKCGFRDLGLPAHPRQNTDGPFEPPEGRGSVKGDIYDFGALMFYLATGQERPPKHIHDIDDVKDHVIAAVRDANPALYDDNSGIVDVIARCRRYYQNERYHSVEGVIQELETFCNSPTLLALDNPPVQLEQLDASHQLLFSRLARMRIRAERRLFDDMRMGVYDLTGDHEDIVSGFVSYLSCLIEGDQYLTLSIPALWRKSNLGVNGRVLTMNKLAAQRKATIRRVFLITDDDLKDPEVRRIIESHARVGAELANNSRYPVPTGNPNVWAGGYYCGFLKVSDAERSAMVEQRQHFGLLITGERQTLAAPVYTVDGLLVGVEFRTAPAFVSGRQDDFVNKWLKQARPIEELAAQIR